VYFATLFKTVLVVEALTRNQGEDYEAFCRRAAADSVARVVKLADLADNADDAQGVRGSSPSFFWSHIGTNVFFAARHSLVTAKHAVNGSSFWHSRSERLLRYPQRLPGTKSSHQMHRRHGTSALYLKKNHCPEGLN
jgi:hypothetical protein